MSEYIFVTNIFEYSNIRIYSSHSGLNYKMHLSKLPNVFVQIAQCEIGGGKGERVRLEQLSHCWAKVTVLSRKLPILTFPKGFHLSTGTQNLISNFGRFFSHFVVPFSCAVWRPLASVNPPKATIVSMMQSSLQLTKQFHNLHFCQFYCQ